MRIPHWSSVAARPLAIATAIQDFAKSIHEASLSYVVLNNEAED